jgi:hypothetical protein
MLFREFPLVRGLPYVVIRKEGENNVTVLVQVENE